MKKYYLFLFCFTFSSIFAQPQFVKDSAMAYQQQLSKGYEDKKESPLLEEDLKSFKGLDFFPIDSRYFVVAKFVRTADEKPFEMKTTTTRKPMYVKYGEASFTLEGRDFKLNIYQNVASSKTQKYRDYLFLPFIDETAGNESYGGGRYIDLKIPVGDTITIDFNRAYNPYCAYNPKFSCPIPPNENTLDIEIRAGVKKFHD